MTIDPNSASLYSRVNGEIVNNPPRDFILLSIPQVISSTATLAVTGISLESATGSELTTAVGATVKVAVASFAESKSFKDNVSGSG